MIKYNFKNDYSEGGHPEILKKLSDTNLSQLDGYGEDEYSEEARRLIRERIENGEADIHLVSGGTQANLIVISSILKSHESVISAVTGHINMHEAGAIESVGHKINAVESPDGKLKVENIQTVLDEHSNVPHMVKPKMVYISNSTEVGTIYKKEELEKLSSFCREKTLYLFLDGARLGSALCASGSDLSLADISRLTDVFYIGGTKNGALLGEAIVINTDRLKEDFPFYLKQKGALMSKGRLLGIQFVALFENDLFFDLAKHANRMSMRIATAIKERGYPFLVDSTSNQIFPILPNKLIEKLETNYGFYIWKKIDIETSAIRLVTSWATDEGAVESLISDLV